MQELSFPLKIHVRRNGMRVIFVEHEQYGRYVSESDRARQDQTRYFCNWIRKTFPSLPTEYRSTCKSWNRFELKHRHFAAYDVTPKEFMMIKLAFGFKTLKVRFSKEKKKAKHWLTNQPYFYEYTSPGYLARFNIWPSKELLARMEKCPEKYRKLTRNRKKVAR
jgi:hypothetical protein